MKYILESHRLLLREFNISDAEKMFELNNDPDVLKYTGDIPFDSVQNAEEFIKKYNSYKVYGFGRWAVVLKDQEEFIGWCGLKRNEENYVDLGFRLFQKFWGNGYATEAAIACLSYGFNELEIPEIIGRASLDNPASIKVLKKIGMEFWKCDECEGIENAAYYRLTRNDFLKSH